MNCFNFISEHEKVREVLYHVCKYNKSKHVFEKDGKFNIEDDNTNFNNGFKDYE